MTTKGHSALKQYAALKGLTYESLLFQEEETQISGVVLVVDISEFGMVHAKNFERNYAKMVASIFQVRLLLFI